MISLRYSININASKERVWNVMLDHETYQEWTRPFSPNSLYEGEWKESTYIKFIDVNRGGTKAYLEEVRPFDYIRAKHVAVINKDGGEDTVSDAAKKWVGTTETYTFNSVAGGTELLVETETHEDYEKMFNNCFPQALNVLKTICEREM